MPRSMSDWEQEFDSRPVLVAKKIWFWTVGILLFTGLAVTAVLWGLGVWTAPWKGKGDAYQEKYSSGNWVAAQKRFLQLNNDFEAYKIKVADAKQNLADVRAQYPSSNGTPYDPGAEQVANARATLQGLTQQCQTVASDYNTDSKAYLSQEFKDAGLPDKLDPAACR